VATGAVTEQEDPATFRRVLRTTTRILDQSSIPYAVFGGLASIAYGRPDAGEDIDLMVRPQDAGRVLESLGKAGYETERTDPVWIYKAYREGVLIDVIFRCKADITLDDEVLEHVRTVNYAGQDIPMVAPEDQLIIDAVSDVEQVRIHWFNALGILAASELDWGYLIRRARYSMQRVLSLLLYARSLDHMVPDEVICQLCSGIAPCG